MNRPDPASPWQAAEEPDALDDLLAPPVTAEEPWQPLAMASSAPSADEARLRAWMERIVGRDEQALAELHDATLSRVYGLVLRVVRQPALAAEVVEDTYFQVWRQAVRFDAARGTVLTWLLGMARSRAIDTLRREARFRADGLDDADALALPGEGEAADELLDATRRHAELHQALLRLQAQPRQLVALAFFRGLSHEEIASQTLLPLGTVKSQIRRTLQVLRGWLGQPGVVADTGPSPTVRGAPSAPAAHRVDAMIKSSQAPTP